MKLRILDDTLRLRLTRSEVARLGAGGRVEVRTCFGPGPGETLTYALVVSESGERLRARFEGGRITVTMPRAMAEPWTRTGVVDGPVGFEGEQDVGGGRRLRLLVEKDFACLDGSRHEPDAYPHPEEDAAAC